MIPGRPPCTDEFSDKKKRPEKQDAFRACLPADPFSETTNARHRSIEAADRRHTQSIGWIHRMDDVIVANIDRRVCTAIEDDDIARLHVGRNDCITGRCLCRRPRNVDARHAVSQLY